MPAPDVDPMIITWGVDRQRHYIENMENSIWAELKSLRSDLEKLSVYSKPTPEPEGKPLEQVYEQEEAKDISGRKLNKRGQPYHHNEDCGKKGFYSKDGGCEKCDGGN